MCLFYPIFLGVGTPACEGPAAAFGGGGERGTCAVGREREMGEEPKTAAEAALLRDPLTFLPFYRWFVCRVGLSALLIFLPLGLSAILGGCGKPYAICRQHTNRVLNWEASWVSSSLSSIRQTVTF